MTTLLQGHMAAPADCRIAILSVRFNDFVVDKLVDGAIDALIRHGVAAENITQIKVPGALELPLAAQKIAASGKYHGIVATGAVIRGATAHFDYVSGESIKGLQSLSLQHNLPIGNAVLTVDTIEQAIERAGSKAGNKGTEAALVVIEMLNLLDQL